MNTASRLPAPFAAGRTAEFFPWQEGRALKLFRPDWSEADARVEFEKGTAVHAAGLPVPAVYELVRVGDRPGIVYERIDGIPLTHAIQTSPVNLLAYARLMADLHLEMHSRQLPGLPSVKTRLSRIIQSIEGMPEHVRLTLLERLDLLPEGDAICHGDFHPENIFLTAKGPVILDWMDAARGHPYADVSRTSLLLSKAVLPPGMPGRRLIQLLRQIFHRVYLKRYFTNRPLDKQDWNDWQPVTAAARIAEDIPGELDMLIKLVQEALKV